MIEDAPFRDSGNFLIPKSWVSWIGKIRLYAGSLSESGPTANRPTSNLWVGRMYFDTSLGARGKPIWCSNVTTQQWVDSASNIV